jgi:carboxymethylenebutenolidase
VVVLPDVRGLHGFYEALALRFGEAGVHAVAVDYYGRVAGRERGDPAAPVAQAASYACPVLGLFGGADPSIAGDDVEAFRRALDAAGVHNELVTYEHAPHSFFDRHFAEHAGACRDAWARVLGFIEANS